MVRNIIQSRFIGTLPASGQNRKIKSGPLYPREEVLALLANLAGTWVPSGVKNTLVDLGQLAMLISSSTRSGSL